MISHDLITEDLETSESIFPKALIKSKDIEKICWQALIAWETFRHSLQNYSYSYIMYFISGIWTTTFVWAILVLEELPKCSQWDLSCPSSHTAKPPCVTGTPGDWNPNPPGDTRKVLKFKQHIINLSTLTLRWPRISSILPGSPGDKHWAVLV